MITINPILTKIIQHLKAKYFVHTIIIYGSIARNEASDTSDYDLVGIRESGEFERDCEFFNGVYLDAFIYSEQDIKNLDTYMVRIKDGIVLCQKNYCGDELLNKVEKLYQAGPPKTPNWELIEIKAWLRKMIRRAKGNDIEGNFRMHWLLYDLLGCYFKLRNLWYLGPKEAFQWLQKYDLSAYNMFDAALKPNAQLNTVENLIDHVMRD